MENPEKILNIAAASTLLEITKPSILPVVAKGRGGRDLKTEMVEKERGLCFKMHCLYMN